MTVTPTGGFSNSVSLSVSAGLPAGATATFTPPSTTGGTSALSITTTGVVPGTYPLTISGTDGILTHTAPATLVVQPVPVGDFTIGVSPSSRKINQNGSSTYTISIGRINGFTGAVSLAASGLPASGLTASFSPNPASGSSSTLTLTAEHAAPPRRVHGDDHRHQRRPLALDDALADGQMTAARRLPAAARHVVRVVRRTDGNVSPSFKVAC